MPLSPEVQQRLDHAREKQFINPRNKDTLRIIAHCAFVGLIGPSKTGKTALALEAVGLDPEHFHYVPSTTNREVRDNEPAGTIHAVENTDEQMTKILDDIAQGNLVQYMIHPTDGTFYGTYPQDYEPDKYNLMPLLAGKPADYVLGSPFAETQAIGIVTDPTVLRQRLEHAYHDASTEVLRKRLVEGIDSARSLSAQHKLGKLSLLNNVDGELERSARALIDMVKGASYPQGMTEILQEMLEQLPHDGEKNV